jgi:hypothetical protein
MRIALDFPPKASFRFQIPSVEVHRDIRDSDELSRQIVTAKVGRDITIVGHTRHSLLDLFDLGTYHRAFASPYLHLLSRHKALDKRHPPKPIPVIHGSSFRSPRSS